MSSRKEKQQKLVELLDTAADIAEELDQNNLAQFLRYLHPAGLARRLDSAHRTPLQQLLAVVAHPASAGLSKSVQDRLVLACREVADCAEGLSALLARKNPSWEERSPANLRSIVESHLKELQDALFGLHSVTSAHWETEEPT